MSRDWTPQELAEASRAMKAAGYFSYEEFCKELERIGYTVTYLSSPTEQLKPPLLHDGE